MAFIKHISSYIPKIKVTNDEIATKFPDWNSQQIFDKIGIKTRNITDKSEFTSDIATKAIKKLLSEHQIEKEDIDYLIVCTQSPDYFLPTTACVIQNKVGLKTNCGAIDINQGCSGFIYGLSLADALVSSGGFKNIILVTAETYSKYIHESDKGNISLFGDAATATLISTTGKYKIGKFSLGTDGKGAENLMVKNGASRFENNGDPNNLDNFLSMKGREIFKFTIKRIPGLVQTNLEANNWVLNDVDMYVFHQANTFMLDAIRKKIGIKKERFLIHMEELGNTVSSTIPLALQYIFDENYKQLMLVGFGVGYSWGAVSISQTN